MLKLTGILGDPVAHSLSPAMHNAAFAELGMDWRYEPIHVTADEFEQTVRSLVNKGYVGVNVTIPHKLKALQIADQATDAATVIGAANTLSFSDDSISAENTDAGGFLDALNANGLSKMEGKRALLLGAGGTARAASWALLTNEIGALKIWNRTTEKAEALAEELGGHFDTASIEQVRDPDTSLSDCDLIINTTSVGLEDAGNEVDELGMLNLTVSGFKRGQTVVDFVYRSGGTAFVSVARSRGAQTVDGVEILVYQGARSFEVWTGKKAPVSVMMSTVQKLI